MKEVAEAYGFQVSRSGFIKCPFHSGDKNGSLKIYPGSRGFHCFGCQAGGSVIDFTMKLFGLSFSDAIKKLDSDFSLGLSNAKVDVKARSAILEKRKREKLEEERRERQWWDALKKKKMCDKVIESRRPHLVNGEPPEALDPLFAKSLHLQPFYEYWLNEKINER